VGWTERWPFFRLSNRLLACDPTPRLVFRKANLHIARQTATVNFAAVLWYGYRMTREEALERFAPRPKWRLERIIHYELKPPPEPYTLNQHAANARWARYRAQQLVFPPQLDPDVARRRRYFRDPQRKHRARVSLPLRQPKHTPKKRPSSKSLAEVRLIRGAQGFQSCALPPSYPPLPSRLDTPPRRFGGGHRPRAAQRPVLDLSVPARKKGDLGRR